MQQVLDIFREVHDPRAPNARHELASILFIALAATLCGQKTCVDIAEFAEANIDELSTIIDLPHGPPSHDCFSRIFRLLDPAELAAALGRFVAAIREGLGLGAPNGVIAVDGKALRRGYERGRAFAPPLMISVWDTQTRVAIGTARAPGGNEVAATLALLKTLVLKGCIVTADALHCHPKMAETVLACQADYALTLKGNHGPLHDAAVRAFEAADAAGFLPFHETTEAAHDRREWRCASVLPVPADAPAFPGLAAIARIEAEREHGGTTERAVHYLALSKMLTPQRVLAVKREHWGIENHLHWSLDVVFDEDGARTRKDYGPENLAVFRRIALAILNAYPDKRPLRRKMLMALMSKPYFYSLFAHMR